MAPPAPIQASPAVITPPDLGTPSDGGRDDLLSLKVDQGTNDFQAQMPLSNLAGQCGGRLSQMAAARFQIGTSTLFPSALVNAFRFHPFIPAQDFSRVYRQAREQISAWHQRLIQPNLLTSQSVDKTLEDLNLLDQGLDSIENIIFSIHATPPDISYLSLTENLGTDWEKFITAILSSEPFYRLIEELKKRVESNYQGKYNRESIKITLEKWLQKIKFKSGVGLDSAEKARLEKARGELKKAEFEYAAAFALTATTWMHFDPNVLIGFKQEYNGSVVTWLARLFTKGEKGLQTFLEDYNKTHPKKTSIDKEHLADSLNKDHIVYLKEKYFQKHPEEFIRDENRFVDEYADYVRFYLNSNPTGPIDAKKISVREFYNTYLIQHPDREQRLKRPLEKIVQAVEHNLIFPSGREGYANYLDGVNREVEKIKPFSLSPDLKIPVLREASTSIKEFSDFVDHVKSEKAAVYGYKVYWENLDRLMTPKGLEVLRIRNDIAKALGFSNFAELKSLQGQTLYANPKKEVEHWMRVGRIVRRLTQKHWEEVVALQKKINPDGLPPSYENSQPYHDALRKGLAAVQSSLAKLEFGSGEDVLRQITMPNISRIYGTPYREITGTAKNIYPIYHPDTLVFGNDCSVYTWDLFDHPGKKSAAAVSGSIVYVREMGRYRNYYANILLTLPPKSSNPQIKLEHLMTMIHEPAHPAFLLTPTQSQKSFYNLGDNVELLNDFLTRFSEREYLNFGVPEGVDYWNFGTLPNERERRKINRQEIEQFRTAQRLTALESFEMLIPRGVFSYAVHIDAPSSSELMAKRFIDIASQTYNEPFINKKSAFARATWGGNFAQDNYGPAAVTAYLNPDLF